MLDGADNIFNQRMYLGDASEIESHLNNDWTVVLKNLKLREDHHYELLQYNRRIISKQRDEDDELFVNDEILHHHQEVAKIVKINSDMENEEKDIIEKYEGAIVSFEEIVKLMGRVGARVLETCQSSLDKCKSLDEELVEKHHKMKTSLVKLLNQKDKINLEEITGLVITYTKIKLLNQIEKLRRLIKAMENGELQKLEEAYQPKQPKKPIVSIEKKRDVSIEKVKVSSVGKDPKPSPLEEIKKQEKLRKEKQKLAARLVHGVYSTMQLAKQQFIEDMCGHQKQKINRLYNQIFSRNKFNHEQIMAFESKKDEFQEKVKIFKEMMERESRRLSEALLKKPVEKVREQISQSFVISKKDLNDHNFEDRSCEFNDSRTERRLGSNRYRISSPKTKREVRDTPISFTSALQGTQQNFTHFKFDTNGNETYARTNRNKLPQIGSQMNRGTSLDHKLQISKSRQFREQMNKKDRRQLQADNVEELAIRNEKPKDSKPPMEPKQHVQRTKMALKNIQVGVDGVVKKDEQMAQSKDKRKVEPNPMEYTFYVKRSGHKFYQPKHNIIF